MMICINDEEALYIVDLLEFQNSSDVVEDYAKDVYSSIINKIRVERGDDLGE